MYFTSFPFFLQGRNTAVIVIRYAEDLSNCDYFPNKTYKVYKRAHKMSLTRDM